MIGDLNIDILNSENTNNLKYLSILQALGYKSLINIPTWVTLNTSTCLDHIFMKRNLPSNCVELHPVVINTNIIDHYPVYLDIKFLDEKNIKTNSECMQTTPILDKDKFIELISKQKWDNVF